MKTLTFHSNSYNVVYSYLWIVEFVQEQKVLGLYLVELGLPIARLQEELLLPVNGLLPQLVQLQHLLVEELVLHLIRGDRVLEAFLKSICLCLGSQRHLEGSILRNYFGEGESFCYKLSGRE